MTESRTHWRMVDGVATAWFDAASLGAAAELAGRVAGLTSDVVVDVRASGARVRLRAGDHAEAVSQAARDLGLTADTAALQHLSVVLESAEPAAVQPFWQRALDYAPAPDGLADPLRRDPGLRIRPSSEPRALRNRIHLDVVRPAGQVEQAGLGEPYGPYGVRLADPDGNEVDLVPGSPLGETPGTADWQVVFGALACYRVTSAGQQRELAAAAAALADDGGFPLIVDLRPGLVVLDSGKDRWEADAHGLGLDFEGLAADLQTAARRLGAVADHGLPRFVQIMLDAADVAAVRAFWAAALGYGPDLRDGVTDLHDPRRLNPVLLFQALDAADAGRRAQRNRLHLELAVPADLAADRVAAAVAAGGRVLDDADGSDGSEGPDGPAGRLRIADPEGNELVVVSGT